MIRTLARSGTCTTSFCTSLYSLSFILYPRVNRQDLNKCFAYISASLDLDLSSQYININHKLFEVYAMYENKFGNLRNQQTCNPNIDQRRGLVGKLFPLWVGVAHHQVQVQHQQ